MKKNLYVILESDLGFKAINAKIILFDNYLRNGVAKSWADYVKF